MYSLRGKRDIVHGLTYPHSKLISVNIRMLYFVSVARSSHRAGGSTPDTGWSTRYLEECFSAELRIWTRISRKVGPGSCFFNRLVF